MHATGDKPAVEEDEFRSFAKADELSEHPTSKKHEIRIRLPSELTEEDIERGRLFIKVREEEATEYLTNYLLEQGMELPEIERLMAQLDGRR